MIFWTRPISRTVAARPRLTVEALEDRSLPSAAPIAVNVHGLTDSLVVGKTLFFATGGDELWRTDGTLAGTALVKDLAPTSQVGENVLSLSAFTAVNGTLFFTFDDPDTTDAELWKSDGTDAGTVLVKDFGPGQANAPSYLTAVNDTLFFLTGRVNQLWKSDGTPDGTTLVKQISTGYDYMNIPEVAAANGRFFFSTRLDGYGAQLWTSDGTEAGTFVLATDTDRSGYGLPYMGSLTAFQGELFYVTSDYGRGPTLWKSDGTLAGTVLVTDFHQPDNIAAWAGNLTDANGTLYFLYDNFSTRIGSLWKSDGTADGTVPVKFMDLQSGGWHPHLTGVGSSVFFGSSTNAGDGLWTSDGTEAGTTLLATFPDYHGSLVQAGAAANGLFYFGADDNVFGPTLWQSDGTAAGTVMVPSTSPGDRIGVPGRPTALGDKLLFFADSASGWHPSAPPVVTPDTAFYIGFGIHTTGLKLWSVTADNQPPDAPADLAVLDPKPIDDSVPNEGPIFSSPGPIVSYPIYIYGPSPEVDPVVFQYGPVETTRPLANKLYAKVLGRPAGFAEAESWGSALQAGLGAGQAAEGFVESTEYLTDLVVGYYDKYLGRAATQPEIDLWRGALQNGMTYEEMAAGFLTSPEFITHEGGTPKDFVQGLYGNLLGRTANADEVAAWTKALAQGLTPRQVVADFLSGLEFCERAVDQMYERYLGRSAAIDPGSAGWVSQLLGTESQDAGAGQFTGGLKQLQLGILGSAEFTTEVGDIAVPNPITELWV
jgi:ELWxxDGT repeat protein